MPELTPLKEPDWSKFAERSAGGRRRKAVSETLARPNRKQCFARVPEDMFSPLVMLYGPSLGLVMALVMRARLADTRRSAGWVTLPSTMLAVLGLAERRARAGVVKRLVARGMLETRSPGPGMALEYRLHPVEQWFLPAQPPTELE
jgi:hypothetical protein